jgi:hypothetical protein
MDGEAVWHTYPGNSPFLCAFVQLKASSHVPGPVQNPHVIWNYAIYIHGLGAKQGKNIFIAS